MKTASIAVVFLAILQISSAFNGGLGGAGGINGGNGGRFGKFGRSGANGDWNNAGRGIAAAGVFSGIWDSYMTNLEENPILTKACTSFVGFSVGDVLAQKFIATEGDFDYKRLARLATFGFTIHGTIGHFWYNWLDEVLAGTSPQVVVAKVFIDQVLWNPVFGVLFFTYLGLTQGDGFDKIIQKIKNDLFTTVKGSWTVWPLAHLINFRFVPTEQRMLYINSIQICYNVFLSFIGSK
mmetsp:Transcript_13640/g.20056  ORF Transcript_13640/g.20056 Transcript_13640/m.20056 type:complete len:237 (-) Transcript_13640:346-1056(-)|eukprot:CAMPEP_0113935138 /NCGR_PEP_ID=MMETSP1339-20121228/2352_1 /TAXON_ID=94617 /ORGANISM="Fibrocapsa japonica" /LENGTH=236 /DNA_ID=CAMNT_0000937189 /DNA_START=98 /DNA_END=808 /DNA_ORIENTATION=+ /assembly_acc=CAM_ASM_000762